MTNLIKCASKGCKTQNHRHMFFEINHTKQRVCKPCFFESKNHVDKSSLLKTSDEDNEMIELFTFEKFEAMRSNDQEAQKDVARSMNRRAVIDDWFKQYDVCGHCALINRRHFFLLGKTVKGQELLCLDCFNICAEIQVYIAANRKRLKQSA